jgi:hypothetical protein
MHYEFSAATSAAAHQPCCCSTVKMASTNGSATPICQAVPHLMTREVTVTPFPATHAALGVARHSLYLALPHVPRARSARLGMLSTLRVHPANVLDLRVHAAGLELPRVTRRMALRPTMHPSTPRYAAAMHLWHVGLRRCRCWAVEWHPPAHTATRQGWQGQAPARLCYQASASAGRMMMVQQVRFVTDQCVLSVMRVMLYK